MFCDYYKGTDFWGLPQIFLSFFRAKNYAFESNAKVEHLTWIQEKGIYNIRLGERKGSMSGESAMFEQTSHLVLYDVYHPDRVMVYEIISHSEMSGKQLKAIDYPTRNPGKTYMTFKLAKSSLDAQQLISHRLTERITEDHPEHIKGTPVFIVP